MPQQEQGGLILFLYTFDRARGGLGDGRYRERPLSFWWFVGSRLTKIVFTISVTMNGAFFPFCT